MTTPLPTPPSSSDSANFTARSDAFLGALPVFQTEMDALGAAAAAAAATASAGAVTAIAAAANATTQADRAEAASVAAGATPWTAGSYTQNQARSSLINQQTYRFRLASGTSATDPSLDPTQWALVATALANIHAAALYF